MSSRSRRVASTALAGGSSGAMTSSPPNRSFVPVITAAVSATIVMTTMQTIRRLPLSLQRVGTEPEANFDPT